MGDVVSRLRFIPNEEVSQKSLIKFNKVQSAIRKEILNGRNHKCYYCGKEGVGFCNSHTIPAFCLKYISHNGKLGYINTIINSDIQKTHKGVNEAGVFHLICRQCDGTIFQEYENESSYDTLPTTTMLAQIMMKNSLRMISKRLYEKEYWQILTDRYGYSKEENIIRQHVIELDIEEYKKDFIFAKKSYLKPFSDDFYLNTAIILPYRIPIAFQGSLTLISDLEDKCINNIYNADSNYKTKSINVMVIPFKEKSVVILFVEKSNNRYKSFFKSFNKLNDEEKLSVINYMMILYSEDYYFNPALPPDMLSKFRNGAETGTEVYNLTGDKQSVLAEVIEQHSFGNRHSVPNLLSEKYSIKC